jgi:transketolase
MVGAAAGLALRGRIPVVHALSAFLTMRAFEFIRTDTAIPSLPVKFVGSLAGFLSEANGPTHQALEDISLMRSIPGMGIFCPADEEEMIQGLPEVISSTQPFYIRFNPIRTTIRHRSKFSIGRAERLCDGLDGYILTYGALVHQAVDAHNLLLKEQGISVGVVSLRTLRPVDEPLILEAAKTGFLFTLEDHFQTGGLYSIVCELVIRHQILCRVIPFSLEDSWFHPGLFQDVLDHHGFTANKISNRILKYI